MRLKPHDSQQKRIFKPPWTRENCQWQSPPWPEESNKQNHPSTDEAKGHAIETHLRAVMAMAKLPSANSAVATKYPSTDKATCHATDAHFRRCHGHGKNTIGKSRLGYKAPSSRPPATKRPQNTT